MGMAILLQYKQFSSSQLAKHLWWLGAFGVTHGFAEWGTIFITVEVIEGSTSSVDFQRMAEQFLIALSFVSLLCFGARLTVSTLKKHHWLLNIPWILGGLWLIHFILYYISGGTNSPNWYIVSETWSRYLLCFPGSMLAGVAFLVQQRDLPDIPMGRMNIYFPGVAASFFFYAIVGGLVVPVAPFFPASYLNMYSVTQFTGIPVPFLRSIAGGFMAYFSIRIMSIFHHEFSRRLEEAEKKQTVAEERERIARDLHDGIIQSVYAVGLELENCSYLIEEKPREAVNGVENAMGRLNRIVHDIRLFIQGLRNPRLDCSGVLDCINEQISLFQKATHIQCTFVPFPGVNPDNLTPDQKEHLYHIIQELLINVVKHAQANKVQVSLEQTEEMLVLTVNDNGRGMNPEPLAQNTGTGQGLPNILTRTSLMGGSCSWQPTKGGGTSFRLEIPYQDR